ncbi:MAG: sigma-70 family RNA polymerase sigma factor [Flammeovirgaceae bacterium]|nr:sigma-70 family RNA polymerase sigma factor [Flammeovirgaceae bacterium]
MSSKNTQFESLYKDYYPMVEQIGLGFMKGDLDLAKDLAQEVFINTWNSLSKFKGGSSHKTWIYRVTVNTCLKYIRDKKITNQISINQFHEQLPISENLSNQTANQHQFLYKAIGQLAEVDRLIIMMVLDELEYEEISKVIGISSGNLRVKIHRIKKNLKTIMKNG